MSTTQIASEIPPVLITGGSGLIGDYVINRLADEYRLVVFDIEPPDTNHRHVTFIKVDLTDDKSVASALEQLQTEFGNQLTSILHLAAYYDFSGEPSPLYQELTVDGTRRLLKQLREKQIHAEQFVFSSSLLVMRSKPDGKVDETDETVGSWDYPDSKLKAEQVIQEEAPPIPIVIHRVAAVYDEKCHSLPLSQQISRIYEKQLESYVFPGNESHGHSMIHLADLADCFAATIEKRRELGPNELFLIAEPDVVTYGEFQDNLGELIHGKEWTTLRIPKFVAKTGAYAKNLMASEDDPEFIKPWMVDHADDNYDVDTSHATEKLGWTAERRIRDTLPAIVDYLKTSPRKFYEQHGLPLPESLEEEETAAGAK